MKKPDEKTLKRITAIDNEVAEIRKKVDAENQTIKESKVKIGDLHKEIGKLRIEQHELTAYRREQTLDE